VANSLGQSVRDGLQPRVLSGHGITVEPVTPQMLPDLSRTCNAETFRYYSTGFSASSPEEFCRTFATQIADAGRLHFVVRMSDGSIVGSSGFYDVLPAHRRLELGCTWYRQEYRGTHVNPACKLLLLSHAFETLGCVRVQIKTDARNIHSQRAIEKLGAIFEGRLRHHFIMSDGFIRDTMMYSITNLEWPKVKSGLLARLEAGFAKHA
jgi:N-acetyltransferase